MEVSGIQGLNVFKLSKIDDNRGYFRNLFDSSAFNFNEVGVFLSSVAWNRLAGTVRGLHFLTQPSLEWKLVTCLQGSIMDYTLDVRENSPTFGMTFSVLLNDENCMSLLIPPGVAHGYQTLEDDTLVIYYMNDIYNPELERKINILDPKLDIQLRLPITEMSQADRNALSWPIKY